MAASNNNSGYVPGVCNIGKKEIEKRRRAAIFGIVLTALVVAYTIYFKSNMVVKAFIFIPLFVTTLSFVQTAAKFCVAFGMMGVFSFDGDGKNVTIEQQQYLKADKVKAIKLIAISMLIAGVLAALYVVLPI